MATLLATHVRRTNTQLDDSTRQIYAALTSGASITIGLIIAVLSVVAYWKVFTKAGQPGWAALIPIYNVYVSFKVAGLNPWLMLLLLIPFVNLVIIIYWAIKFGASFGKGGLWSFFLLVVFSTIGILILAFGSATYRGPQY